MSDNAILERPANIDPNPDRLGFLPIDPFAALRDVASRVLGLGGPHPGGEPGYVFQSLEIYPVLGPVRFTLQFHALVATKGTLTVKIHAISAYQGTAPMLVQTVTVPLRNIVDEGGIFAVALTSRRNMIYSIGGTIDDETDATAIALSLSLDPRERDVPLPSAATEKMPAASPLVTQVKKLLERPELATMRPAVLARPVSQALTHVHRKDPLITAWNDALHQSDGPDIERWENALILQALHYYGIATDSGLGLGIERRHRRLSSYFAGRGCNILAAATQQDDLPERDPGLALEHIVYADLCPPRQFFEAVDLTVFENLAIPVGLANFDFLWSIEAYVGPGARMRFPQMLRDSVNCLRPGGIAVHMLRYSGEISAPDDPTSTSYGRAEIERMALSLVADGQEVAQLKFDVDIPDIAGDQSIPFALIARRIR